jgi:hypothetical protein
MAGATEMRHQLEAMLTEHYAALSAQIDVLEAHRLELLEEIRQAYADRDGALAEAAAAGAIARQVRGEIISARRSQA